MSDVQGGGAPYMHFAHVHGAQYQQAPQQRPQTQLTGTTPVGIRNRERPSRGSGGGAREQGGGHQRRGSRDSDAGSSASEHASMPPQQHPQQASGVLSSGDAMGMTPSGGSTPKGTQRPAPPPGFGAAPQAGGPPRQPTASNGLSNVADKPAARPSPAAGSTGPMANGVHLGGAGAANRQQTLHQQQQAPAAVVTGSSGSGAGQDVAESSATGGAGVGSNNSSGGGGQSTHLNPAAPPFRSLHGGSLEQVEGSLLAQADANGLKDTLSKLRSLMRQRDAIDTCLISEASGLVAEAERLAEAREQQRQQQAALEEARAAAEALSGQLADRDSQLASVRRQLEDKEAAVRARDAQVRKLDGDLAESRRRGSSLERDVAAAERRADTAAVKLATVEQELGALREAYKAQSESHAMEQQHQQQQHQHQHQQQQQAAQQQQHQQHQQQHQHVGDGWHHSKAPHLGPMGQPLHQMAGGAPPPDGSGGPGGPAPHFAAMGLAGLGGPSGGAGLKGAPPPGAFQVPPPPLFNPLPGGPGGMDAVAAAAAAAQMAGFMDAASAAGGAGGLFGGDRFLPPPPPGMALPPGFHLPPHPHGPPHPMGHFGAPPLPTPEEIQAKILDLLPSDPADALQWDERMDGALDGALAPLQWARDLSHVYGSPRGFMMAHPELFAQRQDGAVYRAPRGGSAGGSGGGVGGRLMGMPPPPGMAPHGLPHGHAPFGVMPGLSAAGLMFGNNHY